jgi:GNAT superfamily N-acetyltransferase
MRYIVACDSSSISAGEEPIEEQEGEEQGEGGKGEGGGRPIIEGNGKVLGFAQLTKGSYEPCIHDENVKDKWPNPVELQRFYVGVGFSGQGIGKLLCKEIERMAREMGMRSLWLGVWYDFFSFSSFHDIFFSLL